MTEVLPMPKQSDLAVLRAAVMAGFYESRRSASAAKAGRLVKAGLLAADGDRRFLPTLAGQRVIEGLDGGMHAAEARDTFGLVATIERARRALDDGDVLAAKMLASGAYGDARARAAYAQKFGAAGRTIKAKARQLQGDALLIETRCDMSIAAAWGQAQEDGKAAKKGRPKMSSDGDIISLEDAGLTRQEIHAARKLLDAEQKNPGFAERAIAARVAAGLEPSRRNLKAQIGAASATKEERGVNLYETPPEALAVLLAAESFDGPIWEPACGRGAISKLLEAAGFDDVILSDLVDYGTADRWGQVQFVADFRDVTRQSALFAGREDVTIITNPPYGDVLNAFVAHALREHRPVKMALLMNVNVIGGFADPNREYWMGDHPPARIHWFTRRLPMMHRDGWDGNRAESSMNTAWFVWERDASGGYSGRREVLRWDWKQLGLRATPSEGTTGAPP